MEQGPLLDRLKREAAEYVRRTVKNPSTLDVLHAENAVILGANVALEEMTKDIAKRRQN